MSQWYVEKTMSLRKPKNTTLKKHEGGNIQARKMFNMHDPEDIGIRTEFA